MRLSSRTRYGVRALFHIAYHNGGGPASAREVAQRQDIPVRFLEQVFQDLKKAAVVESRRGPGGGYYLARAPESVTLGDVLRAIEGPIEFGRCVHSHDGVVQPGEHITGRCVTGDVWQKIGGMLTDYLDGITIADLCARAHGLGIAPDHPQPIEASP